MRKIFALLFLSILITGSNLKAQIVFSQEYGGVGNEDGRWMEQLPDSGFILTGGTTTYSNGQSDIWLVRTDAYGTPLWTKSIGSTSFDFANMVKPVTGGGFIICGLTARNGSDDAYLVRTDNLGNTLWEKILGDGGTQWFEAVIQTTDGGYAAVGVNTSGTNGGYDFYLVKFDALGVTQWERNIGGGSYEIGNSLQQTADGGYILTGQTYSYGNGDGDYYLVKTNASGVVQWERTYAQPYLQEAHYVQITPDGGFIIVGDADTLSTGLGSTDIWLIRTDSLGNQLWDKVYGGTKKDGGKTVENTSDGGFIIAGITRSFGLINPNYYLIKTDNAGNFEWHVTSYGSAYHDHAYRGIETSDGGFAEFGYFRNSAAAMNFSLVKLGPNGGVNKDIAIDNITAPKVNLCRSNNVSLSVVLTNYGATTEQNIPVIFKIDNGSTITTLTDTFVGNLLPNISTTLTFSSTYNFNVDGTYNLKAYIPHRPSDISYTNDTIAIIVNVIPPTGDPSTTSAVRCSNGTLTLNSTRAAAADSMFWYDAPVNGNLVSTGTSYTTPSLSSTTTYYVQSIKGKGSITGAADNSIGSGSSSNTGYLKFDSRTQFKLVSVLVYPSSAGNRTIELRNSGGTVLQSKTINLPSAPSGIRVYLDFDIPQANDLQLGLSGSSGTLFRNSGGAVYPYSISQTLEIYGSSSSSAGNYYYFYNWHVFVPSQNCESNRVPVQAIIGSGSTTAFDKSRCGNGSVTLTANSSSSVSWYDAATGGTLLSSNSSYTTPSLSTTTTYYVESASCSNRIAVNAIINNTSTNPVASDVTRCGPGTVTLTATSSDPVNWYNAATNGTVMGSGLSFTTPFLSTTTTYYAIAGTTCPSAAVAVDAIINGSNAPTVTSVTACGPASVTLSASSTDPLRWYTSSTGGSPISSTSTYTTPVLSSPVTYYVEAGITCPSARVPVTANIIVTDPPVGTNGSRCGNGSVVISAQSLNPVTWWSAASGGSQLGSGLLFTTPSIATTTTYYAQASNTGCNSQRTPVVATINVTTPPSVTNGVHCGPGAVTLQATSPDSIFWYSASTGGTQLATGNSYTTPSISTTTTYYAQAGNSCPSTRVAVSAIITNQAADPVTTGGSRCGTGTVAISATSALPITWYDAPGGSIVGTGNNFTTPSISTTTTYYAVAGSAGCVSNAIPTIATVNTAPASPTSNGGSNCGTGTVTLTATSASPLTWYDAPGGTVLDTGSSFTTPSISATTTYYVTAGTSNCMSNAVATVATINPLAPDPVGVGSTHCGPGQQTLTATAANPMTWYSQATGGSSIATGNSYTANFNATTTVYVEANDGRCPSNRIAVVATVYTLPFVNLGPPVVNVVSGQTITLDAGPGFSAYLWSTTATSQTINVNTAGVFYVTVTDIHSCQNSDTITVNLITGLTENDLNNHFNVYPNPTQGMLNITTNDASLRFDLQITDVIGQIILTDSHVSGGIFNKEYNLNDLAKGLYYLQVFTPEGNLTRTLIIQ